MNKIFTVLIIFIGMKAFGQAGGVSINPTGTPPDPSAAIDINYNNKGMLMPRLSIVERNEIVNPATGLFIYNTDCNVVNYNTGTPSTPNWATVNASNALIAAVSIFPTPVVSICSGTDVTFTATPSAGINSPNYQWQVNGSNVGSNINYYSSTSLNNGDVVTCILSSAEPCVAGSPATSNAITMAVNSVPSAPGSIAGSTAVCQDSTGNVYSITPVADANSYNWTVPSGAAITAGSGSTSITVNFGTNSGNVSVAAVNSCGAGASTTDAVTVTQIPATPGTISGPNSVCPSAAGQVYSINSVSGAISYNWTVPAGASIAANSDTAITVSFGANPAGNIAVSATSNCGTGTVNTLSISQSNICSPLTFSYTGSFQTFTVPAGVTSLTIEAWGAQGGAGYNSAGGYGADMKGTFTVNPGDVLSVGVGQQPPANSNAGGGGGSSGAMDGNNLLIVAGGGGGGSNNYMNFTVSNAVTGTSGQSVYGCGGGTLLAAGGTNGSGGAAGTNACGNDWPQGGGGAGVDGNGGNTTDATGCTGGLSSGTGGNPSYSCSAGGFGFTGGGGSCFVGGGGGGYSGGGGAASADGYTSGGGGGSYDSGANQTNTGGENTGNGQIVITW